MHPLDEKLPVGVMAEMTRFAVPQLVTTTGCDPDVAPTGIFPKLMLAVLKQTAGAVTTPVPVNVAAAVTLELLMMLNVAPRAPEVVGLKETGIKQFCPAGSGLAQLLAWRT